MGPALQANSRYSLCTWALPFQLPSKSRLAQPPCWHSSGRLRCLVANLYVAVLRRQKSRGRCRVSPSMLPLLSLAPKQDAASCFSFSQFIWVSWLSGRGISVQLSVY